MEPFEDPPPQDLEIRRGLRCGHDGDPQGISGMGHGPKLKNLSAAEAGHDSAAVVATSQQALENALGCSKWHVNA